MNINDLPQNLIDSLYTDDAGDEIKDYIYNQYLYRYISMERKNRGIMRQLKNINGSFKVECNDPKYKDLFNDPLIFIESITIN